MQILQVLQRKPVRQPLRIFSSYSNVYFENRMEEMREYTQISAFIKQELRFCLDMEVVCFRNGF